MRILIADDDATSRLVLTGVLNKNGHDVLATVDGTGAWEAMQQPDAPKLAILDWMMPGLSGVDVCRRVRALASDHPPYLIILTSRGEKADIVAGLDAGADDYLAKPFDAGELRARVEVGRRMIELQETLSVAREALDFEARHDPLTGALNRRAFNEILSRELIGERRHGHGLALGICDVDQFKKVNDALGHQAGDEVLCGIVRLVETNLARARCPGSLRWGRVRRTHRSPRGRRRRPSVRARPGRGRAPPDPHQGGGSVGHDQLRGSDLAGRRDRGRAARGCRRRPVSGQGGAAAIASSSPPSPRSQEGPRSGCCFARAGAS